MKKNKNVLLIFPGVYNHPNPYLPLSILVLGAYLERAGFNPVLIDTRVQPLSDINSMDFFMAGISAMTGTQVTNGLIAASAVKKVNPEAPIVWGGVHASILPENTLASQFVDIVVNGEGELTLAELAERIYKNESYSDVKGITYSGKSGIVINERRPFIDINTIPVDLPYDKLPLSKYPDIARGMEFPLQTGRGCQHRCTFCYNYFFNDRKVRLKSPDRVLEEIDFILKKYPVKRLGISAADDNFFSSKKRSREILEGIVNMDRKFGWSGFCRFDYFSKYDMEFIELIEKSNCDLISFGGESGSPDILKLIQKDITPEQIIESSQKMSKTRMLQITSFMTGFPGEKEEDFRMTMDIIDRISEVNHNAHINGIFVYTPYPGTPLYNLAVKEYGYKPPASLEEWGRLKIYDNVNSPWISKKRKKLLGVLTVMTRLPFNVDKYDPPDLGNPVYNFLYRILAKLARFRWKHRFFVFPLEWIILKKFLNKRRGYV